MKTERKKTKQKHKNTGVSNVVSLVTSTNTVYHASGGKSWNDVYSREKLFQAENVD